MIVSFPVSASGTDPDTGASRMPAPASAAADANDWMTDGGTVLMSTRTELSRAPDSSPSAPARILSISTRSCRV